MAKPTPYYGVAKLLSPEQSNPYYIFETHNTLDGLRTRIHRGGFNSEAKAMAYIEAMKPPTTTDKWEEIKKLVGTCRDGSQQTVTIFWDDATGTAYVRVGKEDYWGHSLDMALEAAIRPEMAK